MVIENDRHTQCTRKFGYFTSYRSTPLSFHMSKLLGTTARNISLNEGIAVLPVIPQHLEYHSWIDLWVSFIYQYNCNPNKCNWPLGFAHLSIESFHTIFLPTSINKIEWNAKGNRDNVLMNFTIWSHMQLYILQGGLGHGKRTLALTRG